MKWINIKDEMPPVSKYVLWYLPYSRNITVGVYRDGEIKIEGQFIGEPTHWMSLPAPPNL